MSTTNTTLYHILFWIKFQLKWYLLMSGTSLVFSSLLFLSSTVPSTTLPHQQKVGKLGIQEKDFRWTSKRSRTVVCGRGRVEKSQICKIHPLAAFCHFGASWKVIFARFVTFERREIEVSSFWQKWSTLCALQHCFWWEDLKTNILGSKAAFMKI